ncbi:hypothetical protein [Microcoleus asticus]|nr:hypothetical protein [Microcoleus asticus]
MLQRAIDFLETSRQGAGVRQSARWLSAIDRLYVILQAGDRISYLVYW